MCQPLIGLAKLMRRAFACESLEPVARELLQRVDCDPADANALLDLATIFQLGGDPGLGLEFQERALAHRQHYRLQNASHDNALKVLVIASRGLIMDNMPVEFLLEHSSVQLETLYLGEGLAAPHQIPEHDVAIIAVCESDTNQPLLEALESVAAHWPRPILNAPARIAQLSRDRLGKMVRGIRGLKLVESQRVCRRDLHETDCLEQLTGTRTQSGQWIIRPVSTHAGHGLEKIQSSGDLADYLARNVAEQYFVAPFIDYRSDDGKYRKYRIALIGGRSYPVHMALSPNWMVHYLNADMLDNADNRREEAAFMQHYAYAFGGRHRGVLQQVAERIGLDYVVLDCAETSHGELLLFEADNGAVVHSMDSDELFPYKRPAMEKIFDATLELLWARSGSVQRVAA
ncbi:MAG: hypothetical protein ACTHK7_16325 [Aureliella sp.]